jgi:hypothetical protein
MAEIPGYWRDPNTGKYFKIGPGFTPPKLGFGQPKTLAELHPIKSNPVNRFIFEKQADTETEIQCKPKLIPSKNAFSGSRKSNEN